MRIISGRFRGRRFTPPAKNWPTRPTTDSAKEGLFNMLQNRFDFSELSFLDLFGGTGNHCFEIISRGCENATYVDNHIPAIKFVKSLSTDLGILDQMTMVKSNVKKYIAHCTERYDYIFADPPYALPWLHNIPDMVLETDMLKEDGVLVIEHGQNTDFNEHPRFISSRKYGETTFSFFE